MSLSLRAATTAAIHEAKTRLDDTTNRACSALFAGSCGTTPHLLLTFPSTLDLLPCWTGGHDMRTL